MDFSEISPAELVADVLNRLGPPDLAAAGAVVGPANDAQQQMGVIELVAAGQPEVDHYSPVQNVRVQMRCLAPTLEMADTISQKVRAELEGRGRTKARMASTDRRYLIHTINIDAGPSMHYDSPETWECLLFASVKMGTEWIQSG